MPGGAGCLGAAITRHYLEKGVEIAVLDNFATGSRDSLPVDPRVRVFEGSVSDRELVGRIFSSFRPTHVVHAAASYKDPLDWEEDIRTNVTGSAILAEAGRKAGIDRFVNLQTALCFGRPSKIPIPGDHPCAPFTSYGISKTAGESYLLQSGLNVVSLRIANTCAPGLAIGPLPTFYSRLKSGKACFCTDAVRDFMDISDFLSLLQLALDKDAPQGVFNVSTGEGQTIAGVYGQVARHLGLYEAPPELRPVPADDVPAVVLDPSATEAAFGWRAMIDFETTVQRQLRWYDAHGVGPLRSHLRLPADARP